MGGYVQIGVYRVEDRYHTMSEAYSKTSISQKKVVTNLWNMPISISA